eukprot:879303-Prorocentrum_lima.AAC.1
MGVETHLLGPALNKWRRRLLRNGYRSFVTPALRLSTGPKAKGHGGTWVLVDRSMACSSPFAPGSQLEGG